MKERKKANSEVSLLLGHDLFTLRQVKTCQERLYGKSNKGLSQGHTPLVGCDETTSITNAVLQVNPARS